MTPRTVVSRRAARKVGWWAMGLALLGLLPGQALADDEDERRKSWLFGFSPYFTAGPYTTIQRVEASVDTDYGPSDDARNTLTNLGWMFTLGIQTPPLADGYGKPRIDLSGGLLVPTNTSSAISSSVSVTAGTSSLKEETKLQVDYNNSYQATVGVEFLIESLPVDIQVMPGFRYLHLDTRYVGEAESERTFLSGADPIIRSGASKVNLVQHFVGPSLRVTTETVSLFGLNLDLFVEGTFLIDVNGTDKRREVRNEENRRTSFEWEAENTGGLVSAGLRILLP